MTGDPSDTGVSSLATSTTSTPASLCPEDSSTRPTIILPAWKDHQAAAAGFWPHLKTMAERARAGIATAPLSPSADVAEDMAGMVIDPRPDDNAGPAQLGAPPADDRLIVI
jgi:hypothetical protein